MPEYINELVDYLKDSFEVRKSVFFDLDIAQVSIDVLQAVPVGLILNEAITNALKYAFPFTDSDCLTIRLTEMGTDELSLVIADNGRGLPEHFDIRKPTSFGMKLMKGLSEEIGGVFTIKCDQGTAVSLLFHKIQTLQPKEV